MREIKFRAWDAHLKKMHHYPHIWNNARPTHQWVGPDRGLHTTHNKIHLMQFTGLQDSEGVDIYEGDVVSDHVGDGVVEYRENKGAFRVNYKDGRAKWFIDYTLRGEFESIEVIGNIYQNEDLLK